MYPVPSSEKLIETRSCKSCKTNFPITDKDLEFYDKISPVFNGKKYQIPAPSLCPDCRQQKRLVWRNERKLYRRTCSATGKNIISAFSPDKTHRIYDQDVWDSDSWSGLDYGCDYNPSVSVFGQLAHLIGEVPLKSIVSVDNDNCQFTSICAYCKDCYIISASENTEESYYCHLAQNCKRMVDSSFVFDCELGYGCINAKQCYNCYFVLDAHDSRDCYYCSNINGCNNCFLSHNLNNASYVFENKQVSKEEYIILVKNFFDKNPYSSDFLRKIAKNTIRKNVVAERNEEVIGSSINDSKNVVFSFDVEDSQNIRYSQIVVHGSDCMDCSNFYIQNQYSYNMLGSLNGHMNAFGVFNFDCSNVYYSYNCFNSSYLFLCTGVKNKQYCILNKQYTKEQYEALVPKIIEHMQKTGEWGEFFPSSLSPFGYNETVANEYFPLTKEEAKSKGFNWSDYEAPFPKVEKIIPANKLPDDITKIPDDILNWAVECEVTGKPFRIIKQELEFYRKHNLPIPKRHPDQRHKDRMELRNPRKLFERKCDKCHKDILTTYAPDRPETVYCEECYTTEMS